MPKVSSAIRPAPSTAAELAILERCRAELAQMQDLTSVLELRDKAVAIRPQGIIRIIFQKLEPENHGEIGASHRHTGMAGIGLLNGVHRQASDRVRRFLHQV